MNDLQEDIVRYTRLLEENEALRKELNRREGRNPTIEEFTKPWPKHEVVYLHGNKEFMRDMGERIGLKADTVTKFKFAFAAVTLKISIEEDGAITVLSHDLPQKISF